MESLFESGRRATAAVLKESLLGAPLGYLEGVLVNPSLSADHLLLILRNPAITSAFIARISRSPVWMKPYEVRALLVQHPKTSRAVAMSLVGWLRWRDLARVAERPGLDSSLRRAAEVLLARRIQEMSLGERVALARIASRAVIHALREDASPMVLRALLQNPRLSEEDVLAIVRNPVTPAATALHLVRRLAPGDLRELTSGPGAPPLVAIAAERLLATRRRPVRGPSPHQAFLP